MKSVSIFGVALVLFLTLGCGGAPPETETPAVEVVTETVAEVEPAPDAGHDVVYACACGPDCECGSVSAGPGTCDCGSELVAAHLLKVEGNDGLLCSCGPDCTCEINADDPTKCGCGKDVKRVSFEGKGLYYCNCGGSCTCNFVAAEPGKCSCGMDLVTS